MLAAIVCAASTVAVAQSRPPVIVHNAAELADALRPGNAGRRIELAAGDYAVNRPLVVPDGATLAGAGEMQFDGDGLPAGFAPGTSTTLRVTAAFDGSVLTLGNGSRLERLRVLDLESPPLAPVPRRGNVVKAASRAPGDRIDAYIVECELVNPNPVGFTDEGPAGHGVLVLTLNPRFDALPAAHAGAQIKLSLQRSIVRTDTGATLFANNFAAGGKVDVLIEGNRLEGRLIASGGTSRPEAVRESVTHLTSRSNLYRPSGSHQHGWLIMGASSSPHYEELPRQGAQGNLLRIDSTDDRIEAFRVGIQGSAARRVGADSQRLNDNRLQLNLERTRILTDGHGAADLRLRGALSEIEQEEGPMDFAAGDRNELRVTMIGVSGSGTRDNVYADVEGPSDPGNAGTGNRLLFQGSRQAWLDSNRALDPAPPERYFSVGSAGRSE